MTSYEVTFQLIFSRLALAQQDGNYTFATAVLVEFGEICTSFPAIFKMPKKGAFLTNLKTFYVDIFENKTPV